MRFSYAESMVDPTFYAPLAIAAEAAGYDSMVIPDSICYPQESESTYPFNPDGTREFLEGKPFIEPFTLIPALGAVTSTLRFVTFVVKLPIRHPVLVAKSVTSTAVMTNNRLALGVGTSPWREDYEMLGLPWENRGKRMDESLDILRGLQSGEYFEYHGGLQKVTVTNYDWNDAMRDFSFGGTTPKAVPLIEAKKLELARKADADFWKNKSTIPQEQKQAAAPIGLKDALPVRREI